ncbi:transglycosylase SLT domain-containing protein [Pusillimonas sp. SM2304]|uniref:lytic transglycosylase domain-containing protein n=1 Tax=Pusillimonas sp. SM2304 TaxID=3073241 RepID=UPI00287594A7|nr:transglycosylase SLT domain-containing protein [Pusillimonas sp. SM2304]MDS1139021.1 transglycosylase SLT domain-containing protein [Pusillimonas sp. SM2304]
MINTRIPHPFTTRFPSLLLRRNTYRTALGLLLVCGMLGPASLLANSLSVSQDVALLSDDTLRQWPAPAAGPERLGDQHLQTLAEEASKQAQAKYLAKKFRQSATAMRKYVDLAWAEAEKRDGIEPELLIAIMQKESSLRPRVQSRYGAQGLMQVVRRWHREKLSPSESLFDPEVNIRVGTDILEEYLELAGGSLTKALGKYSGNARGYPGKILKESRKLAELADQAAVMG